ncbi:MAG: hypothetical protein R3B45_06715 [Bdellovibrionota bacterium]
MLKIMCTIIIPYTLSMIVLAGESIGKFMVEPYSIRISWQHNHDDEMLDVEALNKEWPMVCKTVGEAFVNPSSAWGQGLFSSYSCDDPESDKGRSNSTNREVELKINDSIKKMVMTIQGKRANIGIFSKLILPGSDKSILLLRNRDLLQGIVTYLIDYLPVAMRLTEKNFDKKSGKIVLNFSSINSLEENVNYPEKLTLFKIGWDRRFKLWKLRKVSETQKVVVEVLELDKALHQKKEQKSKVVLSWKVLNPESIDMTDGAIWAHYYQGPGQLRSEKKKVIRKIHKAIESDSVYDYMENKSFLTSILTAPISSAYLGARFGFPQLKGVAYADKARFVGLFAEIRSGWFDGFRLVADNWPRVEDKINDNGDIGRFEALRVVLNWSFRFKMPFLVDSIDITPAIGQWSFLIDLPNGDEVVTFETKNALSFGLGLGAEWTGVNYILRLWYNRDFAFAMSKAKDSANVVTQRGGIDFMYRLLDFRIGTKAYTISALAFMAGDNIYVEKIEKEDPNVVLKSVVNSITYVQAYAGGGLSFSW